MSAGPGFRAGLKRTRGTLSGFSRIPVARCTSPGPAAPRLFEVPSSLASAHQARIARTEGQRSLGISGWDVADCGHGDWLDGPSRDAYADGLVGEARVGPLCSVPGMSKLARVSPLHRVAAATIGSLLHRIAATLAGPAAE